MQRCRSAFTLVEILIVVVILGVLSAVVVPRFAESTEEAAATATQGQLRKLRDVMAIYQMRNGYQLPNVEAGTGTWGELVTTGGDYLKRAPVNRWVGPDTGRIIIVRDTPDTGFHNDYGWIFDEYTGQVWAAGFDENDEPFPKQ